MKRVLIADDEPMIGCMLHMLLKEMGYEATVVQSGKEAYALLTACREKYDLAILDIHMPEWNGIEVVEIARGLGTELPIILMSGYMLDGLNLPANVAFISKPFTVEDLKTAVASTLS